MAALLERELGTGEYLLPSAQARAAALARASAACAGVLAPLSVWRRPDAVVAFTIPALPGASLAEVQAQRALALGECILVGVGVAQALAAMHAQRVAHGDVSAANVMVDGKQVTLVDTMGALADGGGASPPGDVAALGELLRSLADAAAAPVIAAWTAPLLTPDATARPTAAHAAAALSKCAPPEPVRSVAAPVTAAIRSGALPRTVRRPQDRWWRAERAARRLSPLAALVAVGIFAGLWLMPATAAHEGPEEAAVHLTERRIEALASGDAAALADLTAAGSEAAADNPDAIDEFTGLVATRVTSQLKEGAPDRATVEVTSELSGYSVGPLNYPAATVTAVLELVLTPQGWLVARILPVS